VFQLIPYGEDTEKIKQYSKNDAASQAIMRIAQARWSAFPNIYWCISNDRQVVHDEELTGRKVDFLMIDVIGKDAKQREPWGTLITNHQARFTGYDFLNTSWTDIITLEDIDQVHGKKILEYRKQKAAPAVLDEDRYELYRDPGNHRYFFRRYMWGILLSGGHPTYGGIKTYEADDGTLSRGIHGYFDANHKGVLSQGAHDFKNIHKFFKDSNLTLIEMQPNDQIVGGDPLRWKCCHNDSSFIIYLANPTGETPRTDNPAPEKPSVEILLPEGQYSIKWFDPRTGQWFTTPGINGLKQTLTPPGKERKNWGDWVLLIQKLK